MTKDKLCRVVVSSSFLACLYTVIFYEYFAAVLILVPLTFLLVMVNRRS